MYSKYYIKFIALFFSVMQDILVFKIRTYGDANAMDVVVVGFYKAPNLVCRPRLQVRANTVTWSCSICCHALNFSY